MVDLPDTGHPPPHNLQRSPSLFRRAKDGGGEGDGTLDPHVANVVLSQLSYSPTLRFPILPDSIPAVKTISPLPRRVRAEIRGHPSDGRGQTRAERGFV